MKNGKNSNENNIENNGESTTQSANTAQKGNTAGENRICVISILVTDLTGAERINAALSAYGQYIIGRMGVPYKQKNVSVISVALDAPVEITNALTGKIGKLKGVYVKALFGKI